MTIINSFSDLALTLNVKLLTRSFEIGFSINHDYNSFSEFFIFVPSLNSKGNSFLLYGPNI